MLGKIVTLLVIITITPFRSVAYSSNKQYLSICHDTPDKGSRRILLFSSHFRNKESGIKKMNPFVVFFYKHLLYFRHCPGFCGFYGKEEMVPVLEKPTFGRDSREWRSDMNAVWWVQSLR